MRTNRLDNTGITFFVKCTLRPNLFKLKVVDLLFPQACRIVVSVILDHSQTIILCLESSPKASYEVHL